MIEWALEPIQILFEQGKQDQLKEFAEVVKDRALATFMWQAGYRSERLAKISCNGKFSDLQCLSHGR